MGQPLSCALENAQVQLIKELRISISLKGFGEHVRMKLLEVIDVLSKRVRVLTLDQIARTWFSDARDPREATRQALRRAERDHLIQVHLGMAHPEVKLTTPLYSWRPGTQETTPHFGRLAWKAKRRFSLPPTRTTYVTARREGILAVGSAIRPRPIRKTELTHDIHVAQLYLNLREQDPESVTRWVSEDALHRETGERTDALIAGDEHVLIEFIGAYSSEKLATLHERLVRRGTAFQFW
jgi:hypothetical protein